MPCTGRAVRLERDLAGNNSLGVLLRLRDDADRRRRFGAEVWRQATAVVRHLLDLSSDHSHAGVHPSRRLRGNRCRANLGGHRRGAYRVQLNK